MNRFLPLIVFLVVSAIGIGMTAIVYRTEEAANRVRFEVIADDTADRIRGRVSQSISLLGAVHAFFSASQGEVSNPAFATFVTGLDREGDLEGVRGIGYARLIKLGDERLAEADLVENYNLKRQVWPQTDQAWRTPIVLLEPSDARNQVALGYDMFNERSRRAAMQAALDSGLMRLSAPVELVQEITEDKQAGFLVYLPFPSTQSGGETNKDAKPAVEGFVYAPFRAGDLHIAVFRRIPQLPVVIETYDTTDGGKSLLFRSANFEQISAVSEYSATRVFNLGGRQWTVLVHETPQFRDTNYRLNAFILSAISLLLAGALATSTWFQSKAVASARELQCVYEKSVQERDMMLQEMKHRIKNSIARVLAIARQTVASSGSLEEFSSSFSARLNAMANAQDILTRSHWQRGDLQELLNRELEQVFGQALGRDKATGPSVSLDERTTQALGLTFHELATNALKYGGISEKNGDLEVRWELQIGEKSRKLVLDWVETAATSVTAPEKSSFGTRLIDANITGELGGTIKREFDSSGLSVRMMIPIT